MKVGKEEDRKGPQGQHRETGNQKTHGRFQSIGIPFLEDLRKEKGKPAESVGSGVACKIIQERVSREEKGLAPYSVWTVLYSR